MTRSDRSWTAVVAECGLDRARPLLASLCPVPFGRINLARALAETDVVPERSTPFAEVLQPKLAEALGPDWSLVSAVLEQLPFDDDTLPATAFWRGMFRNLTGAHAPALPPAETLRWATWLEAFRGRVTEAKAAADWVRPVVDDAAFQRDLSAQARAQRKLPMTEHDRSIYVRFGWNDDGDIAGMAGIVDAAALLRTQRAWVIVVREFDAGSVAAIEAAATRLVAAQREAALANLDADSKRYGVPKAQLAAELYPVRAVPPLQDILTEAMG